jgi:plastocyanin
MMTIFCKFLRGSLFPGVLVPLIGVAGCSPGPQSARGPYGAADMPASAAAAAFAAAPASQPSESNVSIDNFSFNPATITVPVGTTVTWVNHDDVPHTTTANDKAFKSPTLDTDERFSHQFTTPGAYPYFCSVHPHMTGQVIVK